MSKMNIKKLKKKHGEGKGLIVVMDNDCSYVYLNKKDEDDWNAVFEGEGYQDCEDLWKTLFPKAKVEWV